MLKSLLSKAIASSGLIRSIIRLIFPTHLKLNNAILRETFLENYIRSLYSVESLKQKRFFNIGAGNQRSQFSFWSYIDLKSNSYDQSGIDLFYDLESLSTIPLESDYAEVIFNSFVIEHISIDATKNLCREAFRILKKGGVFHSKVHCYEYGYRLLSNRLISPQIPFNCRESNQLVNEFIVQSKGKFHAFFNDKNEYVIESTSKPTKKLVVTPKDAFIFHNATSAMRYLNEATSELSKFLNNNDNLSLKDFFYELREKYIVNSEQYPHQHNASYFPKEELFEYIKSIGFSDVYFTQPYQSVCPALWEDVLNPTHKGFTYSIEAIK